MEAGALLTQGYSNVVKVLAHTSQRWSKTDACRPVIDRECMAVMWEVNKFQPYIWGRQSTLITDYSVLTWLFKVRPCHRSTTSGL